MGKSPLKPMLRMGISSDRLNSKAVGSTFALLKVGQSALEVTASILSCTFSFALSLLMFSSNSTVMSEKFSNEVDSIPTRLGTPLSSSSKGSVMSRSISSAVFPGYKELTKTSLVLISG